MHRLRTTRLLVRVVLAWFVLSLGAAIAAPLVDTRPLEMVCAGGTMKFVVAGDDGGPAAALTLDCPLCASVAPPLPHAPRPPSLQPLGHCVQSIPAARLAALTAGPLPARGPPTRS